MQIEIYNNNDTSNEENGITTEVLYPYNKESKITDITLLKIENDNDINQIYKPKEVTEQQIIRNSL